MSTLGAPAADESASKARPVFDTVPKLLLRNAVAACATARPCATRTSASGRPGPGRSCATRCARFAVGLRKLGLERGDAVAIIGDNRPRLYATFAAVQSLGGIPVPVYQDSVADEMAYVLEHAEVKFAVVAEPGAGRQGHLRSPIGCRSSSRIIYDEPRGLSSLRSGQPAFLRARAGARARGDAPPTPAPSGWWLDEIAKGKGADVSVMLYTSGTTGRPKGVMLTHDNIIVSAQNGNKFDGFTADDIAARLPADGLGRRSHLLLRPGLCRRPCACAARKAPRPWSRTGARSARPISSRRRACSRTCSPRSWCAWRTRAGSRSACSTISSAWRGAAASRSSTASRSAARIGCSMGWATCSSTRRCETAWASRARASPTPPARPSGPSCSASTARSAST